MKENNDQMMDFDVLMTKSNGHMETQFIYKRMALPNDSVDVDGLTLTLTDKRTHRNVGHSIIIDYREQSVLIEWVVWV